MLFIFVNTARNFPLNSQFSKQKHKKVTLQKRVFSQ